MSKFLYGTIYLIDYLIKLGNCVDLKIPILQLSHFEAKLSISLK